MINLLSLHKTYEKNKTYIDNIIKIYPLINIILFNNDDDILNKLTKPDMIYSNNIILHQLNEGFIKKIDDLNLNKYNIYLLNYENLNVYGLNHFNFLKKYNINLIDYSINNKNILDKYILFDKQVYYLPLQIDSSEIYYLEDKNCLGILSISELSNTYYDLLNHLDSHKISDEDELYNDILKYKIIFIDKFDELLYLPGMTSTYYDHVIQKCILNKIIIVKTKEENTIINPIFKKYIIELPDSIIPSFLSYLISNYEDIYDKLYNNFDEVELNSIIDSTKSSTEFTIYDIINQNRYGFIMLRHVNSEVTNKYWIESYNCIRKYYFNKIIIIDDNSNEEFIRKDIHLINCYVIKSDFPKRGEILAYYYLYKYHLFDKAVIIHDSTFVNTYIDFFKYEKIKFLWHFTHHWDTPEDELKLLKLIKNNTHLIKLFFLKNKWAGCFGLQSIIEHSFLKSIVEKYNIFDILNYVDTRSKRMNVERIFALIVTFENDALVTDPSIYGIIHHYIHWGYTYQNYLDDPKKDLALIKVWTGR